MELHVLIADRDGTTREELGPRELGFSAANEASSRCMLLLSSTEESIIRARVLGPQGALLCDSEALSLGDDDWSCISSSSTSRLLSCIRECAAGWVLVFDVKEAHDGTATLTYVRVVRPRQSSEAGVEREAPANLGSGAEVEPAPEADADWVSDFKS